MQIDGPDPTKFPIAWYAIVLVVGVWAGLTRYLLLLRADHSIVWSWAQFAIEIIVSGFVAVMVFWASLRYLGFDVLAAVFWSGVASHFGIRVIALGELFLNKQTDYFLGFRMPRKNDSDSKD